MLGGKGPSNVDLCIFKGLYRVSSISVYPPAFVGHGQTDLRKKSRDWQLDDNVF